MYSFESTRVCTVCVCVTSVHKITGVCLVCLQRSYREAISGIQEGNPAKDRDDRVHGSLLIINELIVNSAWPDEVSPRLHGDDYAILSCSQSGQRSLKAMNLLISVGWTLLWN